MEPVTIQFVLNHMRRKKSKCQGGQWQQRNIYLTSTDLETGRATMIVERSKIGPQGIFIPPFTESIFLDETSIGQFHDPI